jgi:putative flippase GtrA
MAERESVIVQAPRRPVLGSALEHREVRHATKYGIVGVLNVAIDFALYALLVSLGVWYVAAKGISLTVATING